MGPEPITNVFTYKSEVKIITGDLCLSQLGILIINYTKNSLVYYGAHTWNSIRESSR